METKLLRYAEDSTGEELTVREGLSPALLAVRVAESLRSRRNPGDDVFDRLLPRELEAVSGVFWTPLDVAIRIASWFDELNIRTVVDIGSGAGKFCIAASLCAAVDVIGVEQRPRLIRTAQHLAQLFRVEERVRFVNATVGMDPIPVADAYYLYNSFGENLFSPDEYLDEDVELSVARYGRDLAAFRNLLAQAPVGTFVFTYNGLGGALPSSYCQVRIARDLPNVLKAFRKNQ